MLAGINDSDAQAALLADLMRGFRAHVNLIPYNPIGPASAVRSISGQATSGSRASQNCCAIAAWSPTCAKRAATTSPPHAGSFGSRRHLPRGKSMALTRFGSRVGLRAIDGSRRVFITVAEVSGDKHAAQLVRSLKQLDPQMIIEGHGGPEMAAAGAYIHRETVGNAAMGWRGALSRRGDVSAAPLDSEILRRHQAALAHRRRFAVDELSLRPRRPRSRHPGAPSTSRRSFGAWQEWRIKKVRRWIDRLACILPFEEEYFRRHNVNSTFVGHPLFDELPSNHDHRDSPGSPRRPLVIGLLAGSRKSEAQANFAHQLEVAARIAEGPFPTLSFSSPALRPPPRSCSAAWSKRGARSPSAWT